MKRPLLLLLIAVAISGCTEKPVAKKSLSLIDRAAAQYDSLYTSIAPFKEDKKPIPRTTKDGKLVRVGLMTGPAVSIPVRFGIYTDLPKTICGRPGPKNIP